MKTNTLLIKTPEGIVFSQLLAGPVPRFLAWLMDFLCVSTFVILINYLMLFMSLLSPEIATAIMIIAWFVVSVGYGMTLEWLWRGQTIGKRMLRLRVMDAQGLRLQFSQVAIRNLLRIVDLLPAGYAIGGTVCFFSRRAQRLGDIAANTVVIRMPKIAEPNLDQLFADKFNSLRQYPHLEARLRQRVSPAEASVALQAVLRRDEFEPAARVQLFAEIAEYFRGKVEFPADAIEGMPDEQYVRNIVDVLYRTRVEPKRSEAVAA